jgi:hypothetical protein
LTSKDKNGNPGANDWFFVDTPYTGLLAMAWVGVRTQILPEDELFQGLHYNRIYIARAFGTNVGKLVDGVCGAPLVADDQTTDGEAVGAVLGFFAYTQQNVIENVFVPVMDDIVDAGWEVEA